MMVVQRKIIVQMVAQRVHAIVMMVVQRKIIVQMVAQRVLRMQMAGLRIQIVVMVVRRRIDGAVIVRSQRVHANVIVIVRSVVVVVVVVKIGVDVIVVMAGQRKCRCVQAVHRIGIESGACTVCRFDDFTQLGSGEVDRSACPCVDSAAFDAPLRHVGQLGIGDAAIGDRRRAVRVRR